MMDGLLGALSGVSLSMDKSSYRVGEKPLYKIQGGIPGSQIAWTSYKDGQSTGEYQAFYKDYLDTYGNAVLPAYQGWAETDIGNWRKDVIIIPPDYPQTPLENATVNFSVNPIPTTVPTNYSNTGSTSGSSTGSSGDSILNIFEGDVELPVVGSVPKLALVAVGGLVLVVALTSGGGDSGGRKR
jgi:hypothetical protein